MLVREPRPAFRAYLTVLAAAALWASSATVGKSLLGDRCSPIDLAQVRCLGSALLLAAAFLLTGRARLLRVRRRDLPLLALLGAGAMAGVQIAYFQTIAHLQVAAAILLQYLSPVLVFLFAALVWRERVTGGKLAALGLAVAGCFLVAGAYDLDLLALNRAGIAWGLAAAFGFAAYTLLGEKLLARYSPWTVLFYAVACGAVTCHLLGWPPGWATARWTTGEWARLWYVVVLGTALPFGLYYVGIGQLRSSRANIVATSEPLLAGLLAYAFLGEALAPLQLVGGAAVIAAVALLGLRHEPDALAPDRLRAARADRGRPGDPC